jgi:thiamine biosynthesis lipoprotein
MAGLDVVEQLECQMTVYRDDSEISRLNQTAALGPQLVESRLFDLLELAARLHRETGGAFDITTGPLIRLWGFHRRAGRFPPPDELAATLRCVGMSQVQLNQSQRTVAFGRPGVQLNLGGIGKGYALDRCGEILINQGIFDFLIHGGQSSILARGTRQRGDQHKPGWTVALRDPTRPERRMGELRVSDCAVGTSGDANQYFYFRGQRYGHILDPRHGYPAQGCLAVTVLAPNAALADALATAFYVLGIDGAAEYCEAHSEISALFVVPGVRAGSVSVEPINLDHDRWHPDSP